jgi:long-chain acyl-CoA synthetase
MKFTTLPEVLLTSCREYAPKTAVAHKVKGAFHPLTYEEFLRRIHQTAAGLSTCGVKPGSRVAIMSENSLEWALIDWAALTMGATVVPLYPTLPPSQIAYILKDSGAEVVFAGDLKIAKKIDEAIKQERLQTLTVVMHGAPNGNLSLARILEDGKDTPYSLETWKEGCLLVRPDDVATIVYTSGTTGEPKGAMLQHKALTFVCGAIKENLPIDHKDRFVSFLPLAHIYERVAGHFLPISCGAEIFYAESLRTLPQDITLAQPTILLTVPRFLDSVRAKILTAVEESPYWKRKIFHGALAQGSKRLQNDLKPVGFIGKLLDKMVGEKIRARFGNRLRFMVSGGAPLPQDLVEFYSAFGIMILQGYGLTETSAVISVNHPARNRPDSVGEVLPGLNVRIASDGEILVKGPSIMLGYHNKPEATREAIDEEGFFHTGDVGKMEGNRLWITDRKKDIIVLANGKNVAPAAVESALKSSPLIEEAMVIGDRMEYVAALIVPNFEALRHHCESKELTWGHPHEVIENPLVLDLFREEISKINAHLADFERVKDFRLLPERWTLETGELTPTMKVRRKVVLDKYAPLVQALMARGRK